MRRFSVLYIIILFLCIYVYPSFMGKIFQKQHNDKTGAFSLKDKPLHPSKWTSMENRLKFYRQQLNMNQTEFAQFLGIRRELYNKYENHAVPIGLKQLVHIWYRLKTEFEDLHIEDLLETE